MAVPLAAALAGFALSDPTPRAAAAPAVRAPLRTDTLALRRSVVRIVTIADLERERGDVDPLRLGSGKPLVAYGTGLVVDTTRVNGRTEYLILTSHHVVDLSVYLDELYGQLEERGMNAGSVAVAGSRSYVFPSQERRFRPRDSVRVIPVVLDGQTDVAVLRTVDAGAGMQVFDGTMGVESGIVPTGSPVLTMGYTIRGDRVTSRGRITGLRDHDLGVPHVGYTVDIALRPGQSGSPVFLERDGRTILIAVLHAREGGIRYAVPYPEWQGLLCGVASRPQRTYC